MKTNIHPLRRILAAGSLLLAFVSSAPAELQAPKSVSAGLRVLNQVVGHTGRLIASKDYDKVGGEHGEFTEGAAMLREAVEHEPADFKTRVNTALDAAVRSSEEMGRTAAKDGAKAGAAHDDFAAKVKAVLDLFPEDLRPKPRQRKP
jgi:hypothetical protein